MDSNCISQDSYKSYLEALDWEAIHMAFINRNKPKLASIRSLVAPEVLESPRHKFFKIIGALLSSSGKCISRRVPTDIRDINRLLSKINNTNYCGI